MEDYRARSDIRNNYPNDRRNRRIHSRPTRHTMRNVSSDGQKESCFVGFVGASDPVYFSISLLNAIRPTSRDSTTSTYRAWRSSWRD